MVIALAEADVALPSAAKVTEAEYCPLPYAPGTTPVAATLDMIRPDGAAELKYGAPPPDPPDTSHHPAVPGDSADIVPMLEKYGMLPGLAVPRLAPVPPYGEPTGFACQVPYVTLLTPVMPKYGPVSVAEDSFPDRTLDALSPVIWAPPPMMTVAVMVVIDMELILMLPTVRGPRIVALETLNWAF
jgi:hypothetical protein